MIIGCKVGYSFFQCTISPNNFNKKQKRVGTAIIIVADEVRSNIIPCYRWFASSEASEGTTISPPCPEGTLFRAKRRSLLSSLQSFN